MVSQSAQIEQDIKDLQKKIMDIGGSRLMHQKSKVEGIHVYIKLANEAITTAEVAKSKAEKDVAKLGTTITNNTAELKKATEETEALEQEIGELQRYVSELQAGVAEAQEAAENQKETLKKLKAELDEKEEKISAFRSTEVCFVGVGRACRKDLICLPIDGTGAKDRRSAKGTCETRPDHCRTHCEAR